MPTHCFVFHGHADFGVKLANDELWHQLLVDLLDGVNWATCVRLCELSCLDCKSLAAAVVSAKQPHSVVHEYTEVREAVDPRNWGIITFATKVG